MLISSAFGGKVESTKLGFAISSLTLSEVAEALLGLTIFRRHEQMVKVCGGLVSQRLLSLLFSPEKSSHLPWESFPLDAQIRSGAVIQDLFVYYYKGTTFMKWGVNTLIGFDQRKASLNTNAGKEEKSTMYLLF